jgi:hypothetical protein
VVDYAIARKIVDLHSNIEDNVKRVYSREEVLRYITFARQFKPLISEVIFTLYFICEIILYNIFVEEQYFRGSLYASSSNFIILYTFAN